MSSYSAPIAPLTKSQLLHEETEFQQRQLEYEWIKRNAPVIVQPAHDIASGNGLLCVFYEFSKLSDRPLMCTLSIVLESEASYNRIAPEQYNRLGSFCYRSYNAAKFGRTADVNHFAYIGVKLEPNASEPYTHVYTPDYAGEKQTWAVGDKKPVFLYYHSLVNHYEIELPRIQWTQWNGKLPAECYQEAKVIDSTREDSSIYTATADHYNAAYLSSLPPTRRQLLTRLIQSSNSSSSDNSSSSSFSSSSSRPILYMNTSNHMFSPNDANPNLTKYVHQNYAVFPGTRQEAETTYAKKVPLKFSVYSMFHWLWNTGKNKIVYFDQFK